MLLDLRSLSKGAYSPRVPSQKALIAHTFCGSSPVSKLPPASACTSAPKHGWLVVPANEQGHEPLSRSASKGSISVGAYRAHVLRIQPCIHSAASQCVHQCAQAWLASGAYKCTSTSAAPAAASRPCWDPANSLSRDAFILHTFCGSSPVPKLPPASACTSAPKHGWQVVPASAQARQQLIQLLGLGTPCQDPVNSSPRRRSLRTRSAGPALCPSCRRPVHALVPPGTAGWSCLDKHSYSGSFTIMHSCACQPLTERTSSAHLTCCRWLHR